jgi:erythromycin esterase-like protein
MDLRMVRSLVRDFTREKAGLSGASTDAVTNDRELSMYLGFRSLMAQAQRPKKVIIWTATVHAAKELGTIGGRLKNRVPFGSYLHRDYGDKAFVLACSALSGSYALPGSPAQDIPVAPIDSLEYRTFQGSEVDSQYLAQSVVRKLGAISARPLVYSSMADADWYQVLDGYMIFRKENPPHLIAPESHPCDANCAGNGGEGPLRGSPVCRRDLGARS